MSQDVSSGTVEIDDQRWRWRVTFSFGRMSETSALHDPGESMQSVVSSMKGSNWRVDLSVWCEPRGWRDESNGDPDSCPPTVVWLDQRRSTEILGPVRFIARFGPCQVDVDSPLWRQEIDDPFEWDDGQSVWRSLCSVDSFCGVTFIVYAVDTFE